MKKPIMMYGIRHNQVILLFLFAGAIGAVVGFIILYPVNEIVYFYEHSPDTPSVTNFVLGQLKDSLKGQMPGKTLFYMVLGATLGVIAATIYHLMHGRLLRILKLKEELGKDIKALIAQGEGPLLEFKSSFRWDFKQSQVNRALEFVVIKTIAAFMNSNGGTLLIGVADDKEILGLETDYKSLKKKDRDGFEQAIIGAIANNIGTDLCQFIQVIFQLIDNKDVCRLITNPSPRPAFLKQGNDTRFYVRTGGSTRQLNIEEAMKYISTRWPK